MYGSERIWCSGAAIAYAPQVTMTTPAQRAKNERAIRILLVVGVAPIPFGAGFLVWIIGYDVHPHHVFSACVIAGLVTVFMAATQWWLYRVRMKRVRRL
jgi:hypothetical protein